MTFWITRAPHLSNLISFYKEIPFEAIYYASLWIRGNPSIYSLVDIKSLIFKNPKFLFFNIFVFFLSKSDINIERFKTSSLCHIENNYVLRFSAHRGDVFFVNNKRNPVWYISLGEYKELSIYIARKLNNIHNMCTICVPITNAVACICMFIDSTGIIAHLAGIIGPDLL